MRKLSFVKKVEVFFSHKKGKDVVQETDSDSDGDDYYGDDGEGSGGYEVTTYSASYSERVSIEENVCEADDDDDVPASPSKELGRNSSMMDISSNGSLEEMCDEDVCDVCDEDDDDCTSPIAALHSGVFGVPKSAWDIPSVIEEMQCNVLGEDSYFVHDYAVGVFDGVGEFMTGTAFYLLYNNFNLLFFFITMQPFLHIYSHTHTRALTYVELLTDIYRWMEV